VRAVPPYAVRTGNYCDARPNAEGCNIQPLIGPHITSAKLSHGTLTLTLRFHKPGLFVAYLKHDQPRIPYGRGAVNLRRLSSLGRAIPPSDAMRRDLRP
jgi:hypothetical protein